MIALGICPTGRPRSPARRPRRGPSSGRRSRGGALDLRHRPVGQKLLLELVALGAQGGLLGVRLPGGVEGDASVAITFWAAFAMRLSSWSTRAAAGGQPASGTDCGFMIFLPLG